MRQKTIFTLVVMAFGILQPKALLHSQSIEADIRRLENDWVQAAFHNDTATYNRLLADEYKTIITNGRVATKADRLKFFGSGRIRTELLELSDLQVKIYGNVALVTGLGTRRDTVDAQYRNFQYRYTRVWVLRDGRWQCVLYQATTVSQPGAK